MDEILGYDHDANRPATSVSRETYKRFHYEPNYMGAEIKQKHTQRSPIFDTGADRSKNATNSSYRESFKTYDEQTMREAVAPYQPTEKHISHDFRKLPPHPTKPEKVPVLESEPWKPHHYKCVDRVTVKEEKDFDVFGNPRVSRPNSAAAYRGNLEEKQTRVLNQRRREVDILSWEADSTANHSRPNTIGNWEKRGPGQY